eukprot:CAMPEP_0177595870 /NCGR_PEP_ID=MMETSP0419_2-20121207/10641_1 /TAXON_ID=582737 /ORGANISM="Tetraselmis sp., Strain GSL018" /LENGTH=35 /DNA_ID= /DNA_START= /DNA_END= /DNA_ORIENTATION=
MGAGGAPTAETSTHRQVQGRRGRLYHEIQSSRKLT